MAKPGLVVPRGEDGAGRGRVLAANSALGRCRWESGSAALEGEQEQRPPSAFSTAFVSH